MILDVYHWTEYRYSEPVLLSRHQLHMRPRDLAHQRVLSTRFEFIPDPAVISEHDDYFGNKITTFLVEEAHIGTHIKCLSRVEVLPREVPADEETVRWEKVRELAGKEAVEFVYPSPYAPWIAELRDWTKLSFPKGRAVLAGAKDLMRRIQEEFVFDKTATSVSTPLGEVFREKRGVCQDFTHLQIACLRSHGIPARYMSGYFRTVPLPGQPKFFGADASHAWVAFFAPGHGWIELDPTNNRMVNDEYVTIGWGRDYGDVSLIRGSLSGGGNHSLFLSVNVEAVG
jgi:transglutaminase-like putative cysteine protease